MDNIYICYGLHTAQDMKEFASIIYLKNNRNICFYDSENKIFLDKNLNLIDIKGKFLIPHYGYVSEFDMEEQIKKCGGILPFDLDKKEMVRDWINFYQPKRLIRKVKGRNLIDNNFLNYIENTYGKKIFFKTVEKAYSNIVKVDYLKDEKSLIHVSLSEHLEDDFLISEVVNIIEDDISTKEYRVFVLNNEILSISRCNEFVLHSIDRKIYDYAKSIVEIMKNKNFSSSYVVDLFEYTNREGLREIDVIEFNPYASSGKYLYNSADFIPSEDILHTNPYNIAKEKTNLISFCKFPNIKYKNCFCPSKYYTTGFAYDLKWINDFNYPLDINNNFDLGRHVDDYLDYKDSGGIKLKYWNDGNKNVNDFRRSIADKIQTSKEEDFKMMLQLDECPVDANYLFKSVIITDDEPKIEEIDGKKYIKINMNVLEKYKNQ